MTVTTNAETKKETMSDQDDVHAEAERVRKETEELLADFNRRAAILVSGMRRTIASLDASRLKIEGERPRRYWPRS
jgi:hypothetical protein